MSTAGPLPVPDPAEEAGPHDLVSDRLTVPGPAGADAPAKVPALVAGMLAGAEEVAHLDLDETIRETHGYAERGAGYGYSGRAGTERAAGDPVHRHDHGPTRRTATGTWSRQHERAGHGTRSPRGWIRP
ncbi:hypothetical protein ACH9EU_10820 [Kocuria sp. M1R5S2]|uniref:hypothetical protein n=1 Tax=Kocuria rhizosphaerae TaxID=3376285 RepID=UPI0037BB12FB